MSDVKHVYQAINAVVARMAGEGIAKSRNNQAQGFRFRGIDDIYAALSRVLADEKLCILPRVKDRWVTERPSKSGGVQTFTTLLIDFDLVSAVDGSMHTITTVGEAQDSADKSSNKAMSAAMKYACLIAFQIPTEGDNDADAHHVEKPAYQSSASLTKELSASVEWIDWEKSQAATLRNAKTMGQLVERWSDIVAEKAPNGITPRLAAVKDEMKSKLQSNGSEARQ